VLSIPSSGAVTPRVGKKKEVVEPRPGRRMHHLGLSPLDDVDSKVRPWLAEAAAEAPE